MGSNWVQPVPDEHHVGAMSLAISVALPATHCVMNALYAECGTRPGSTWNLNNVVEAIHPLEWGQVRVVSVTQITTFTPPDGVYGPVCKINVIKWSLKIWNTEGVSTDPWGIPALCKLKFVYNIAACYSSKGEFVRNLPWDRRRFIAYRLPNLNLCVGCVGPFSLETEPWPSTSVIMNTVRLVQDNQNSHFFACIN